MNTTIKCFLRILAVTVLTTLLACTLIGCSDAGDFFEFLDGVLSAMSEETDVPESMTGAYVTDGTASPGTAPESIPGEHASLTHRDEVALFIHTYGHLPDNFITKAEAENMGWTGGSLEKYASGCCIGGDVFGNYEGLLPRANGRKYYECDIDTRGASSRGAKRIVYSNDGLIYYTDDHYESFKLLYGNG